MSFMKYRKKALCLALCLSLAGSLAGCGQKDAKIQAATKLIEELSYDAALEKLDEAEKAGENLRLVNRARGLAYMGMTEYEKAEEAFVHALSGSSGILQDVDYDINYYLAATYTKLARYQDAEAVYDAILALKSGDYNVYFLRGNARLQQGNYESALEDFDKAIAMAPEDYNTLFTIYEILGKNGYRETGKDYLRAALEAQEKKMSKEVVGRIYYHLGEYQKACLALEEARESGSVESFLYLGRSYEATGDFNYAASVYRNYLSKNEGNAELYNQLGSCEMAREEYKNALEAFQAGIALEDAGVMQTLAFNEIVAYEYLQEYQTAYELIIKYLKNYPDDEIALRERDFLKTR